MKNDGIISLLLTIGTCLPLQQHTRKCLLALAVFCGAMLMTGRISAAERLPIPAEDTKDEFHLALGPLGVRIKTTLETRDYQGQAIGKDGEVAYIFKNSLGDGKLNLGDNVVGVNGVMFKKDIGQTIGDAINNAEATDGHLTLQVIRGGKPVTVKFQIPILGEFSDTFPSDCAKTKVIVSQACDYLARHQFLHGAWDPPGSGLASTSAMVALALLATGDEKYHKNLRSAVEFLLSIDERGGLECWKLNHVSMFLAEYYLQTGDRSAKAKLVELYKLLRARQLAQTPYPFWFSHGKFDGKDAVPGGAYIYLGVNVANSLLSWSLMDLCGIDVDAKQTAGTWNAVALAGPTGEMPYAAVLNQHGKDSDAWGRTGVLAVANYLTPGQSVYGKKIAGALNQQWSRIYFSSHASSAMGKMWGTLGMAALDPVTFRKMMDHYRYGIALARLEDGRFVAQPGVGGDNVYKTQAIDITYGHVWTTAWNTLMFAPGFKRLRIAGGGLIISGLNHTALVGSLRTAFAALEDGKPYSAIRVLDKVLADAKSSADERKDAELMQAYITDQAKKDRNAIEQRAAEGDVYLAWVGLKKFETDYKGLPLIPELEALKAKLDGPDGRKEQAIGKRYHAILDSTSKPFATRLADLKKFVTTNEASPYATLAQKRIAAYERMRVGQ